MIRNKFLEQRFKFHTDHGDYETNSFAKYGLDNFKINKGIFRSDCSPTSIRTIEYLVKNNDLYLNKEVADVGCGSGVYSILMAKKGACNVIASDISNEACNNAKENVKRYNLDSVVNVIDIDLFEKSDNRFDLILAHLPPFDCDEKSQFCMIEDLAKKFFSGAKRHLKSGGKLIMPHSKMKNGSLKSIDYKSYADNVGLDILEMGDGGILSFGKGVPELVFNLYIFFNPSDYDGQKVL